MIELGEGEQRVQVPNWGAGTQEWLSRIPADCFRLLIRLEVAALSAVEGIDSPALWNNCCFFISPLKYLTLYPGYY